MGLVKGFTDILYPQNLATNGSFRINQRGLFQSWSLGSCKQGDFVADCWQINLLGVDSLNCMNTSSVFSGAASMRGGIQFTGYGKKGQQFSIRSNSIPRLSPGYPSYDITNLKLTATVRARFPAGVNLEYVPSIPLSVYVSPARDANVNTNAYPPKLATLSMNNYNAIHQAVTCIYSAANIDVFTGSEIFVTLLADGDFHFTLSDFALYTGHIANPPQVAEVPLSEDLLRCKRYYQSGHEEIRALGLDNGTYYQLGARVNFPVEMAGTPTITQTLGVVSEEGSSADVSANYSLGSSSLLSTGFVYAISKPIAGAKPNFMNFTWTATV